MTNLYDLLEKIEQKPGMYIGSPNINVSSTECDRDKTDDYGAYDLISKRGKIEM